MSCAPATGKVGSLAKRLTKPLTGLILQGGWRVTRLAPELKSNQSGGEWIPSIDLENAAVGQPSVQETAVIGLAHSKWRELPLLVLVVKAGDESTAAALLNFLKDRVARWCLPDDVVFVPELPHTAKGQRVLMAA